MSDTQIKELDKLVVYMDDTIQEAIYKAENFEINDRQDAEESEIVKTILKNRRLDIDKTRKDLWQPYYDAKKAIDTKANELIAPIEEAEKLLNKKQISYNEKIEEEKRRQQEEMNKLAEENDWHEEAEVEKQIIAREADWQKVKRWINYNKKIIKVNWELLPRVYWNIKDLEITPRIKEIKSAMQMWVEVQWIIFED